MTGITHIAGLDVLIGARLRQRCAWCGAVLVDEDLRRVAGHPADSTGGAVGVPTWQVGALVGVDGGTSWLVAHEDGTDVPDDCCAALDPVESSPHTALAANLAPDDDWLDAIAGTGDPDATG